MRMLQIPSFPGDLDRNRPSTRIVNLEQVTSVRVIDETFLRETYPTRDDQPGPSFDIEADFSDGKTYRIVERLRSVTAVEAFLTKYFGHSGVACQFDLSGMGQ